MLMVVFGAGASYDSFAEYPPHPARSGTFAVELELSRPPLAAELFAERFAPLFTNYPECLGLFPQLRWAAGSMGIERRLAELVVESDNDAVTRQQMVALRFYLREAIASTIQRWQGITHNAHNYAVLLDRLDRWRRVAGHQVALVTFNYDVLLDQAASVVVYSHHGGFVSMPDYISHREYKLLKLHGSTDWRRLIPGLEHRQSSYRDAVAFAGEKPLPLSGDLVTEHDLKPEGQRPVDIPAIAIPVQEKSDFEFPREHLEMLKKCIDATTDLIVIGWRGQERHFLDLWIDLRPDSPEGPPNLEHVLIVDKGEGGQFVEGQLRTGALMDWEDRITLEIQSDGFSAFLRGDRLEAFLHRVRGGPPV